jgi:hypothetical protein
MAIKKVHLPDGSDVVIDEWLHWPTFSTIEFAAGVALNLRAFTYVQGQQVPRQGNIAPRTATESDTNQVARTRMNHDEAYLVYSVTYEHFALSDASIPQEEPPALLQAAAPALLSTNLRRLQRDCVVELIVGAGIRKPQFRAPFGWIGQSAGAPAYTSGDQVTATTVFSYGTGGEICAKNQRSFQLPIFIQSDRVMFLQVRAEYGAITDLTQDVRLRWYLDGLKRRPVA